jgi:hypothetical protein
VPVGLEARLRDLDREHRTSRMRVAIVAPPAVHDRHVRLRR